MYTRCSHRPNRVVVQMNKVIKYFASHVDVFTLPSLPSSVKQLLFHSNHFQVEAIYHHESLRPNHAESPISSNKSPKAGVVTKPREHHNPPRPAHVTPRSGSVARIPCLRVESSIVRASPPQRATSRAAGLGFQKRIPEPCGKFSTYKSSQQTIVT